MSRAEERALEMYPEEWWRDCDGDAWDANEKRREGFIQGYEQAGKDIINKATKWLSEREWTNAVQLSMFRKYMEDEK